MAKTQPKLTTICQDCLNAVPDKVVNRYLVESKVGPTHYIFLCKNCLTKRGK
jgi:hypothetical protein